MTESKEQHKAALLRRLAEVSKQRSDASSLQRELLATARIDGDADLEEIGQAVGFSREWVRKTLAGIGAFTVEEIYSQLGRFAEQASKADWGSFLALPQSYLTEYCMKDAGICVDFNDCEGHPVNAARLLHLAGIVPMVICDGEENSLGRGEGITRRLVEWPPRYSSDFQTEENTIALLGAFMIQDGASGSDFLGSLLPGEVYDMTFLLAGLAGALVMAAAKTSGPTWQEIVKSFVDGTDGMEYQDEL